MVSNAIAFHFNSTKCIGTLCISVQYNSFVILFSATYQNPIAISNQPMIWRSDKRHQQIEDHKQSTIAIAHKNRIGFVCVQLVNFQLASIAIDDTYSVQCIFLLFITESAKSTHYKVPTADLLNWMRTYADGEWYLPVMKPQIMNWNIFKIIESSTNVNGGELFGSPCTYMWMVIVYVSSDSCAFLNGIS